MYKKKDLYGKSSIKKIIWYKYQIITFSNLLYINFYNLLSVITIAMNFTTDKN